MTTRPLHIPSRAGRLYDLEAARQAREQREEEHRAEEREAQAREADAAPEVA